MQKCYGNHAYIHGYYSFAFNILLIFSLSFTSLSLFLSSASWSHLPLFLSLVPHCHSPISRASRHWWTKKQAMPLISKASSLSPCHRRSPPKLTRRRSYHRATIDRRWSFVWSVIFGVLIIFNFLFDQFWIFCLINGFWGFDLFNSLFDQWVLGWWWLMMVDWWWWLMMVADVNAWWW